MIKEFETDYTGAYDLLDSQNPYDHINTGLFTFGPGSGICAYIPEQTEDSCWSVTLCLPAQIALEDFLTQSGWKVRADADKIILFLLRPEKGWQGTEEDVALIEDMRSRLEKRTHFVAQSFFAYLVGYGQGATAALRYAQRHPAGFASLACVGDFEWTKEPAEALEAAALAYVSTDEVPLPAYFLVNGESEPFSQAFCFFMDKNKTEETIYRSGTRWLARSQFRPCQDSINLQPVADVIADVDPDIDAVSSEATALIWNELHKRIRTTGVGPGGLHPFFSLESLHASLHEIDLGGTRFHWREYVPTRNVSRKGKKPLVVFLHGKTQVAESGLYAADWINVAESRDFIVVFPSGGMTQERMNEIPLPGWNIGKREGCFQDDVAFIRAMVEDVCEREAVDESRIYVVGHSLGGAMVQRCLLEMPDVFAAGASNSGVLPEAFFDGDYPTDKDVAVWIEISEHDIDSSDLSNSPKVCADLNYWIKRGNLTPFEQAGSFDYGRYHSLVWHNAKGVPMLRFTSVLDKTHGIMPQDAWSYYDQFFCRFSRGADGSLFYLNQPIC